MYRAVTITMAINPFFSPDYPRLQMTLVDIHQKHPLGQPAEQPWNGVLLVKHPRETDGLTLAPFFGVRFSHISLYWRLLDDGDSGIV